jgi:hypothetical protein
MAALTAIHINRFVVSNIFLFCNDRCYSSMVDQEILD